MDRGTNLPHPSWAAFTRRFTPRWKQGEHVFIAGQTGSGKTELELKLLALKPNWFKGILISKPEDATLKIPEAADYRTLLRMNAKTMRSTYQNLFIAPKEQKNTPAMKMEQRAAFAEALNYMYHSSGWVVGMDEVAYMHEQLKLFDEIAILSHMGRAKGITVVAGTQRPARIPVIVPQSATHAFISRTGRSTDLKTLAEIGGGSKDVRDAINSLRDKHDFLYVDTQEEVPLAIVNTHR